MFQKENNALLLPWPGLLLDKICWVGAHLIKFGDLKESISTDFCGCYPHMWSKGMHLNAHLKDWQCMHFCIDVTPKEVILKRDIRNLVTADDWVHCEIRKTIYDLKESGKLANTQLKQLLQASDYYPYHLTAGLCGHAHHPIALSLVNNNFGVKHINKADAAHFCCILSANYRMIADWTGGCYLSMALKWDYNLIHAGQSVQLSMPGYVKDALTFFKNILNKQTFLPHQTRPQSLENTSRWYPSSASLLLQTSK